MLNGLRRRRLIEAAEKLKWPLKVDYAAAEPDSRRAFEKAFADLLTLQTMCVHFCDDLDNVHRV